MATRRYELTEDEWNQMKNLLLPERTGKKGRPANNNRTVMNGIVWIARSGAPWRDLPERYGSWQSIYSRYRKWLDDGIIDNIFRVLTLDSDYENISMDRTNVRVYQASTGIKKGVRSNIGRIKGRLSTKIHALVDALGNPLFFTLSEG